MKLTKFEQTKTMCVQTGGGSDVVVNRNPNMFNHYIWYEK